MDIFKAPIIRGPSTNHLPHRFILILQIRIYNLMSKILIYSFNYIWLFFTIYISHIILPIYMQMSFYQQRIIYINDIRVYLTLFIYKKIYKFYLYLCIKTPLINRKQIRSKLFAQTKLCMCYSLCVYFIFLIEKNENDEKKKVERLVLFFSMKKI